MEGLCLPRCELRRLWMVATWRGVVGSLNTLVGRALTFQPAPYVYVVPPS